MKYTDLHTHTVFSDGKNTAEEMVLSAISRGLKVIGISDHSHTSYDTSYCIKKQDIEKYIAEINALKEKYKGKIEVRLGIEQDFYGTESTAPYDYVIGSCHYLYIDGNYIDIDYKLEFLTDTANRYFGGDIYCVLEKYYENMENIVERTGADIIGHFDLISKLNEKTPFFDTKNPRYQKAWKKAADKLLKTGAVFEINTGGISRGYTTKPYPESDIYNYLSRNNAKFIYSSDAHCVNDIAFMFDKIDTFY